MTVFCGAVITPLTITTADEIPEGLVKFTGASRTASGIKLNWKNPATPNGRIIAYEVLILTNCTGAGSDGHCLQNTSFPTFDTNDLLQLEADPEYSFILRAGTNRIRVRSCCSDP